LVLTLAASAICHRDSSAWQQLGCQGVPKAAIFSPSKALVRPFRASFNNREAEIRQ
jgi:hypothetical protein